MGRDYQDPLWVEALAKSFIDYCDRMDTENPREQWELERVFLRRWVALSRVKPFPEKQAETLLSEMQAASTKFGSNFAQAISRIRNWIEENY